MKLTRWLLSAMLVTASPVLAQITNSDHHANPPAPATVATAPAAPVTEPAPVAAAKPEATAEAKPKPKHKRRRGPSVKSAVDLNPPATAIVTSDVLNVRGQPSFNGEVIDHLKKGDSVTVMEDITMTNVRADEPDQWSLIALPTNAPVWVDGTYIDAATKAVRVKRVNIRGGPGENYSILGRLDRGTVVQQIAEDKGWWKIETPANAYAFVASEYLEKQAASAPTPPVAAATDTSTPPPAATSPAPAPTNEPATAVTVPEQTNAVPAKSETTSTAPVAPAPTAASEADQELAALRKASAAEPSTETNAPEAASAPSAAQAPSPTQPVVQLEDIPRVVTRNGFVHRAYNIQAPADYELHDIQNGELIEYLQPAPHEKFKIYVGTRVSVTGTEVMDQRWPRTPILEVQTVDLMP